MITLSDAIALLALILGLGNMIFLFRQNGIMQTQTKLMAAQPKQSAQTDLRESLREAIDAALPEIREALEIFGRGRRIPPPSIVQDQLADWILKAARFQDRDLRSKLIDGYALALKAEFLWREYAWLTRRPRFFARDLTREMPQLFQSALRSLEEYLYEVDSIITKIETDQ